MRRWKNTATSELILVGDEAELRDLVTRIIGEDSRLKIVHASEVVEMGDAPAEAVRKKKDSSMRVAIDLVKAGEAHACVSAGNTGALMATAKFVLKMLPGIDRPAIIAELPSMHGSIHMLDLGANAQCTAEQLFQFAVMGSIVTADIRRIENPRVALLNIGAEDTKGNDTVTRGGRAAAGEHAELRRLHRRQRPVQWQGRRRRDRRFFRQRGIESDGRHRGPRQAPHETRIYPQLDFPPPGLARPAGPEAHCPGNRLPELQRCDSGRPEWYRHQESRRRGRLCFPACDRHCRGRSAEPGTPADRQLLRREAA